MSLLCYKHDLRGKTISFLIRNSFKMKRNRLLNNKSFIDKACSIKMAGYWLRFSFPFFIVREEVKVHKKGKKELSECSVIMAKNAY